MRKVLLPLLLVFSCLCFAVKTHKYTFQFSNPQSLIPKVDFTDDDTNVPVTDYVFRSSDGAIELLFKASTLGGGLGAYIDTRLVDNQIRYHLDMASGVQMFVRGDDVQLDSLIFSPESYTGGIFLNSPIGVGTVSPFRSWYGEGATGVHELHYVQNGHNPRIYEMTVYYTSPQNILKSISPKEGETVKTKAFKSLVLQYNQKVKLSGSPSFTLTSNTIGFASPKLKATVNKSNPTQIIVSLTDGSSITALGEYNLIIGENSIITDDEDEYYNPKTVYSIQVIESYDKFNFASVSPASGSVGKISNNIVITFPGQLSLREYPCNEIIELVNHEGTAVRRMKLEYADESYKSVKLVFQGGKTGAVTDPGIYTFTIPEGLIWNSKYAPELVDSGISKGARYNPEITIEYNIGNQQYASEEKLQEAREWLSMTGAGYPAANSASRKTLQTKVANEVGTDAEFDQYIAAYIAEKNVDLPADGKWYRISAKSLDGTTAYLAKENDRFVLSKNIDDAVSLQATLHNGKVSFATIDGLYLHQLQPSNANSGPNYSASECNLQLAHIDVGGVAADKEFGLMTIFGNLSMNLNGDVEQAYALVDVTKPSIETNAKYNVRFTNSLTSAFQFEQVDKPVPTLDYTLAPSAGATVDTLRYITIKFNTELTVSRSSSPKATLSRPNGFQTEAITIDAVAGKKNMFRLCFDDVPAGNCTLTIPQGTFTFVDEGRTLPVAEITASYSVYYSMDFQYDLNDIMQFYVHGIDYTKRYFHDTDLNNFVYYIDKPYTFGVSDKKANIVRLYEGKELYVTSGHFEQVKNFNLPGYEGCGALRLVLDKPIKEGDIESGEYLIDIFEGTFGDANFAKYLKDPTSIAKRECHVNKNDFYVLLIDNEKADQQEVQYPSEAVLAKAQELLKQTGLGYPKTTSKARQELQALAATRQGSDSQYNTKIDAYLKDADVVMPEAGKWYIMANGTNYVRFVDNQLQQTSAPNATPFKVSYTQNGGIELRTVDGLYLKSIANNGLSNESATITIEHTVSEGVSAEAVFGLFYINKKGYYRLTEIPESEVIIPEVDYAVNPDDDAKVESLSLIKVTFNSPGTITSVDPSLITLVGAQTTSATITAPTSVKFEDNVLELSYINLPADDYVLTIPEGVFKVTYKNGRQVNVQRIVSTFTITKGEQFNFEDYVAQNVLTWLEDPKDAFVRDSYMNTVTLVSKTKLAVDTYQRIKVLCDGQHVQTGNFQEPVQDADGNYLYKLKLDFPIVEGSHPKGVFLVEIPEATFGDTTFGNYLASPRSFMKSECRVNKVFSLTANVDNEEVDKQEIVYPSAEVLAKAEDLLKLTGLGYPTAESKARKELQELAATKQGPDSLYNAKIDAYLRDADVEVPPLGKWYIIGVVAANDVSYVQFDDNKLMQSTAANATGFTIVYDTFGNMALSTIDGLYLKSVADNGLVDVLTSVNIGHQVAAGVDAESVFGLFSINNNGYYLIKEIPASEVNLPKVFVAFTPGNNSEVKTLDDVTVKFETRGVVKLANKDLIKLSGAKTSDFVTKPVEWSLENNVLKLSFINLPADTYTLSIAKGAFTVTYDQRTADIESQSCSFVVTEGAKFNTGDFAMRWLEDPEDEYVSDSYLNKFTLVSPTLLAVDVLKKIWVLSDTDTLAVGTFANPNQNSDGSFSYKLKLDKPIVEGSYPVGVVSVVVAEGTFGDDNFDKYLENSRLVKKSDCLVNKEMVFTANVDNVKASVMAVSFTASPADGSVESLDRVTLTFNTDQKVTLANESLLTFATSDGVAIEPLKIESAGDNVFVLTFINLEKGGYVLTADTGAFIINFNGKECPVGKIMVSYYLTKNVDFVAGYEKEIQLTWLQDPKDGYVKDTDLNMFTLLSNAPLVFNQNKTVIIKNATSGEEVARGYMEIVPVDGARALEASTNDYVYGLALNKTITEGSIPAATYEYAFEQESFGDENYGAYLDSPISVSKSACHVNDAMRFVVMVNNTIVGIREIAADADDEPVFDVYGRKVTGQLKKGQVYVKNGKKFIKK